MKQGKYGYDDFIKIIDQQVQVKQGTSNGKAVISSFADKYSIFKRPTKSDMISCDFIIIGSVTVCVVLRRIKR